MSESEPQNQKEEGETVESGTDEEVVTILIEHIDKPCETTVGGEVRNIREFYIREAERLLDEKNKKKITDPEQIERLKKKIQEYKPS